jgi:hypothetical protein
MGTDALGSRCENAALKEDDTVMDLRAGQPRRCGLLRRSGCLHRGRRQFALVRRLRKPESEPCDAELRRDPEVRGLEIAVADRL